MTVASYQTTDLICATARFDLYRARRVNDGVPVLLKRLDPEQARAAQSARSTREYLLLESLNVAGIAKPVALIDEPGCPALVLEDFPGEWFEAVLEGDRRLDLPTCLDLARHLVQALAGLHAAQVIHQDIRPANVLVAPGNGAVLLVDFSIATDQERNTFSPEGCTASAGDWAYLSPEQTGRMNCPVDYRTDFYSLGITLYRMLAGRLPFIAHGPLEWTHCHIARVPPPLHDFVPEVPRPVSDIVMKLLAKRPEDRYQSAHGLQVDLDRCLARWRATGRIQPFPLAARDVSDRFEIPHKLYGRDQQTATLLAAFDRMAASGQAALVTVSGYSGIGKSSLVHELHKSIVRERGYFISGKFDQFIRDIPYATLTQAFRELVQQLLAESEVRIAGWRQQIQAAVGVNGQLIIDLLPQVEFIVGPQAPVPALPPTEAQNRFRLVFQQFMAVFTRKEHPLVLFLDDLQWIDAASLQLIEHLLTQSDTRNLLLIVAYRDNEVDAAHPLMASLEAIRHGEASVIDIRLAPLSVAHLNQLVADTLHAQPTSCEPLTRLVFERTEGNPFFFTQFLDALHREGLLQRDAQDRVWTWDLAQIEARDFGDNVVDLMVGKLQRLPEPAQEALQLAACIGNKFDLRRLALVSRFPEAEVAQRLSAAVRENLIMRTDGSGKFLHDRIQQAAYSLIPEERRAEVHLGIGRALMASMTAHELAEHGFDVANQFNRGAALLIDRDERAQVAEINLRAGRKAKASAAYASACVYLAAGMALLDEGCWDSQYELMFNLWLERANCEFLSSNFDAAEPLIPALLQRGASKVDQAAAYRLKIDMHVVKSENTQAVTSALECLRLFGIDLPAHPSWEQVQAEYETVWRTLKGRPIESLVDLPPMADPEMRTAVDVLSVLHPAAFYTDVNLAYLLLCRIVNLSLQHGTTGASAHGYAFFGMHLGPAFHRYSAGYRFGRLACDLVEKHGFVAYQAKVYVAMQMVVLWTQPIASALDLIKTAYRAAIETGDLFTACYSWTHTIADLLLRGDPLDAVWRESEKGLDFVQKAKFRDVADAIVSHQRFIANMQGRTASFSTFSDAQFDEAAFEAQLTGDRMTSLFCRYWVLKLQARFLSGDYAVALAAALKAKALLWGLAGRIPLLNYFYYTALTVAALYETASADEQRAWRDLLMAHQEQLREWAENYPPTFGDKHALVSAEIARLDGRDADAMRLYEQAIQSSRENGFVQNEGISCELAAAFYQARGFERIMQTSLRDARSCYARWGADGKVRQLDERYPQLRAPPASSSAVSPGGGVAQLDLLSVAKASQAISGRIVLDELVDTLMHIVIESACAQAGHLLLVRNEDLILAAEASVDRQTVQVRLHLGQVLPESPLPASILNYVRRSRERVLLADVAQPNPFSTDPYFARRQPKSVLCLPILRQAGLIGLLYLENSLVTHAFTPERLTVLELLAAQAAISLENALLYADLKQENSERRRAEEALREGEARIRRLVESNIIGIFFWNSAGDITEANDAFLGLVGYGRQDLLSGMVRWPGMTPPEHRAVDARATAELRLAGTCTPYEKEYIRKDGRRIPVLLGGAFLEGSQEHGVAFVLDLTERKQAEAEREARRVADAANQAKSTFLATMSHELRTPLNAILGFAQILQADRQLNERQARSVGIIRQGGEQLLTLINDILDLSRIEAGKVDLHAEPVALPDFLRAITDMISIKAEEKGLQFDFDGAPGLAHAVRVDEKCLRQVLLNLLSNAVKFTERGQVSLRMRTLGASDTGASLRFEVEDSGIGIPPEQLDSIFVPFEQATEVQRRFGGTGLGLSISRQLVRLMGGDIHLESRVGLGSRFWFDLDLPTVMLDAQRETMPPRAPATGYQGARRTLLVVDDIDANRRLLVDFLSSLGFKMFEADNGEAALQQAQALRPDLIVMDSVMPVMDGLEATRRLRQLQALKSVPVIAVSAGASAADQQVSLAAGANAFLSKPIELDKLVHEIGMLLQLVWIPDVLEPMAAAQTEAPEALVPPLAQEMEILYRIAQTGNMSSIRAQADHLAALGTPYGPFAQRLRELADSYQSRAILELVRKFRDEATVNRPEK